MATYGEAAITRLCLKNFLTYGYAEYRPEPGLNMIIGPNGSGKSSLVCAICLALAGQTKLLGRAQHLKDYIKYGCGTAELEIELFQKTGNIVINRKISSTKSDWKINGKPCKQEDVVATVAKLNIQVDNLCQFLPQDRVADFAKMTPQELLVGTEQAVGSLTLIENHEKLKDFQKTSAELTSKIKSLESKLDQNVQLNEHLEAELSTFREYRKAKTLLDLYEAKLAWLVYDRQRETYLGLKKDFKRSEAEFAQRKSTHLQNKKRLDECEKKLTDLRGNETAVELSLRKASGARTMARQKIAENIESIEELQHQFKLQIDTANETKEKIEQTQKNYNGLKAKFDECARRIAEDKVDDTFREVKTKIHGMNSKINQLLADRERLQVQLPNSEAEIADTQAQIQQLEQGGDQQLQLLKRIKPSVYQSCLWLRENRSLFKKKIHEPPVAVMQVESEQAAAFLDSAIGADSLFCFIAEDADDMELFVKLTRKNNWRVNAATAPLVGRAKYQPPIDTQGFADLGVTGFLSELFEAPDAVYCYLCDNHHLHNIPYGNEKLEDGSYILYEKFRLLNFFAKGTFVNLIKSKYSSDITRCTRAIKNPRFLHASKETAIKADLVAKLQRAKGTKISQQAQLLQITTEVDDLTKCTEAIKSEEKKLRQRLNDLNALKDAVRVKKAQLQSLGKGPTDLEKERERVCRRQRESVQKFSTYYSTLCKSTAESRKQVQELARVTRQLHAAQLRTSSIQDDCNRSEQELSAQEEQCTRLKRATQSAKSEALESLDRAKTMVGFGNVGSSVAMELPEKFKRKFEPLTNDELELKTYIADERGRLKLIMPQNSNVEAEYEERKQRIGDLQSELDNANREHEKLLSNVDELESRWKSELNELIGKVDQKFARFFSMLGCEGRILIHCGDGERQYDSYGIKIMVRFREQSELCELTPFHQSGGEKSVSTILYMMALQELTVVPFRVVDEINQGMDSVNERRVFEFIVRTAEANNAQYFLVTPKLLPNLPYSEKMTVHIITPNCQFEHTDWNFDAFLERRRALVGQR